MKRLLTALAIIGFASTSAIAQASFASIDVNQDGGITLQEANAAGLPWTPEEFKAVDQDKNGALDVDEFASATQ